MHALQMDEAEKARRMDTLRYQIQELQRAKLRPGEEEELTSRRNLLRNGEKFMSAVSEADFCLSGDDSTSGALAPFAAGPERSGAHPPSGRQLRAVPAAGGGSTSEV